MIDKKTITVIVTTYKRFTNLDAILQAWKNEPVEEVWLVDGSGKFRPKTEGVVLFSMPRDFGTRMDYALATLTDTDLIIFADDDVLPLKGFVTDLYNGWKQVRGGIVGIIGRVFNGPHYRGDTKFYASNKITTIQKTDFVGVVYFTPRNYIGFDTRGMHNNCDDLWWQMKVFPKVPKHVIPTKKYRNLPESSDGGCMFHNKDYAAIRQAFYKEYYYKNYEIKNDS
jgi:hypothetical protein